MLGGARINSLQDWGRSFVDETEQRRGGGRGDARRLLRTQRSRIFDDKRQAGVGARATQHHTHSPAAPIRATSALMVFEVRCARPIKGVKGVVTCCFMLSGVSATALPQVRRGFRSPMTLQAKMCLRCPLAAEAICPCRAEQVCCAVLDVHPMMVKAL